MLDRQGLAIKHELQQSIDIGMFVRIQPRILGMFRIQLQSLLCGFRSDRSVKLGQMVVDRQRTDLAGFMLDACGKRLTVV